MLTAAQVAAMLGISQRAVYDIPLDRLPRYRLGAGSGAVRFEAADVEAYKATSRRSASPLLTPRILREYLRMKALADRDGPSQMPELTPHQMSVAEKRYRRMRQPPWASSAAINAIYAEAKRLTAETGVQHHVDHVIPLQGELVSGLHVESNLAVIPAIDNLRKRNKVPEC